MPCICCYDPSETYKKHIKFLCQEIIDEIKNQEKNGDLTSFDLKEIKMLLDHLYDSSKCSTKV